MAPEKGLVYLLTNKNRKTMRSFKKMVWALAAIAVMAACGTKKQSDEQTDSSSPKYLVLYYSQTGTTKALAEHLQKELGADIDSITVENPYDGTYEETIERSRQERESGFVPTLNPLNVNLDDYDVIFLGYPIWFGTYAPPVAGLLSGYDFAGKKIVPFCTFGSGGLEPSVADLKQALPEAEIAEGYGVRSARAAAIPKEVNRFLLENGYLEGEPEPLPDYSEPLPVTDEEKTIFEAACSGYRFPLGTPVTVSKRSTPDGTDYCYAVQNADGEATGTIYVTVGNEEGANPEFTRVVR